MRFITLRTSINRILLVASLFSVLTFGGGEARAQSTDPEAPSPVRANTIGGRIAPLDVGDPRLTRHFYRFSGSQGDLVIAVEGQNLNGVVDLFTANGLRPLTQIVLYAAGQTPKRASKSVYLRQPGELILRVEARSPNDDAGSYRIKFEGAFVAAKGDAGEAGNDTAETADETAASPDARRNGRRVSSVGARIETPETARTDESATTTPPADTAAETTPPAPPLSGDVAATPSVRAPRARTRPAPAARNRRPPRPAAPPRRTANRRSAPAATNRDSERAASNESPPQPAAASPRLIVETKDGARIERSMSSVRRVTVDNNQLVIILNDGKVERQAMANVLRFSIEP